MAASALRDEVDGGFFRYATARDWSDPHYERMLYDNALLLPLYAEVDEPWAREAARGIARFLLTRLRLPSGAFASAQDSESVIDGERVEGEYYRRDASERAGLAPPPLDEKVLTGWNGLAIDGLARAGYLLDEPEWVDAAAHAARMLLTQHLRVDGSLVRASIDGRASDARATLEDYGMFATGLIELALVTGDASFVQAARRLVESMLAPDGTGFAVPGGADPVLAGRGLAIPLDPSEGAYPSGISASATAAWRLWLLTGDRRYADAAKSACARVASVALASPVSFGTTLELAGALQSVATALVVVLPDAEPGGDAASRTMEGRARPWAARGRGALVTVVTESAAQLLAGEGFELFAARGTVDGQPTAYLCRDFVCLLPETDPSRVPLP
jgi:uncharacterized protein YyaL (SSP411 family)